MLWSQLFWIRHEQGRIGEVYDVYARAAHRATARPHTRILLCILLCELDRPEEARPVFEALAADGFAGVGYPWFQNLTMLSQAGAVLGSQEQIAGFCDRLAPHHAVVPTFTIATIEPAAHHLAVLNTKLGRSAASQRWNSGRLVSMRPTV